MEQTIFLNGKATTNKGLANYIAQQGGTEKFAEKVKLELNYNNTFIAYETRKITQWERVLRHLRDFGSLTSMEAFSEYGITRLSAVIYDLRHKKHINITSDRINHINRYNEIVYFSNYTLED